MGKSPHHARNVALVLNLETGLVSPQFHLKFDTRFHTVKQENFDSKWQTKAGFILQREPSRPQEKVNNSVSKIQREKKRQRTSSLTEQDKRPRVEQPVIPIGLTTTKNTQQLQPSNQGLFDGRNTLLEDKEIKDVTCGV